MDEALATVALDLGGRQAVVFDVAFPVPTIGTFDAQLVEVVWESFAAARWFSAAAALIRIGRSQSDSIGKSTSHLKGLFGSGQK